MPMLEQKIGICTFAVSVISKKFFGVFLSALGPCATLGLEWLSPICEGVRAHVSHRVRLEMTLVTEY